MIHSLTKKRRIFPGGAAPGFLLASPHLTDPEFERTVVLMMEHHEQGAVGMILNRPTRLKVASAFRVPKISWTGDPEAVIWSGGPVMPESCWMLHEPSLFADQEEVMAIAPHLMISSSMSNLKNLTRHPPDKIRFIRGISGWEGSQLESEIANGLWLTCDINMDLIFEYPADQMWERAYQSLGINPAFLAHNQGIH